VWQALFKFKPSLSELKRDVLVKHPLKDLQAFEQFVAQKAEQFLQALLFWTRESPLETKITSNSQQS